MTRLDFVASVQARIGWKALTADEYQDEGFAFLSTPNIKTRDIDFTNVNYISQYRYDESPELRLRVGDVLLAKDGSTLGIANTVRSLPRPATVNGSIAVIRSQGMEPRFLTYWLQSSVIQSQIQRLKDGMGVPHLFQADIRKLPVPALAAKKQRRIADFLDDRVASIDQIITARRRQIALMDDQIRSISDALLVHVQVPWARLGLFIRRIEQGWSPQCDAVQAGPSEWGVLKVGAVQPGWFDPSENKRLPDSQQPKPEYEVQAGDLLVSRANTPERVGFFAVVPADVRPRLILCDKIMRIQVENTFDPNFVALVGQSRRTRDELTLAGTGTSGSMVNIRGDDVRNMTVPLLPLEGQHGLVVAWRQQAEDMHASTPQFARSIDLLEEYKQSLITAAVTGELDVTTAGSGIPG